MPARFKQYLIISLAVHVAVILLIIYSPNFRAPWQKPTKITWIKLSRGDGGTNKVANLKKSQTLPQSTIKEQKDALKNLAKDLKIQDNKNQEAKTTQSVKKDTPKKNDQVATTKKDNALTLNKKNTTKDSKTLPSTQTTKSIKIENKIDGALAKINQRLDQRNNELTAAQTKDGETGQSQFGGDEGSEIDAALLAYFSSIRRKITGQWNVAKKDFTGNLRTGIVVLIDSNGNILRSSFAGTSGNSSFDESAMRAVRRSSPFPLPPDRIRKEALTEGFFISFNPKSVSGRPR